MTKVIAVSFFQFLKVKGQGRQKSRPQENDA